MYEMDEEIQGFGFKRDPRIAKIVESRSMREDLAYLFDTSPSRVSLTEEEALSGNISYHHGDLKVRPLARGENLTLPERVGGKLDLSKLTSADGLILPASYGELIVRDREQLISLIISLGSIQGTGEVLFKKLLLDILSMILHGLLLSRCLGQRISLGRRHGKLLQKLTIWTFPE